MLRTLAVFIASILVSHLAAADLAITGKWMVSGFTSTTTGMDGKKLGQSTMHIRPGVIAMEIGEKDMTTTVSMIPGQPPQVLQMPYTVQKKSETSMTILLVTPHDKTPKTTVITQEGSGLTLTDDTTTTTVVPYDPAAITAEQKRVEEGNKPADSLTNHSLSGHLNGADWTPIACRRSSFQFDETGKHIRVDVTADRPQGFEPSAMPSLILELPMKPGEYPLSKAFTVSVHVPPSDNTPITNGTLVVYTVTDTAIEFGLTARGMDGLVINGKMTADVSQSK